MLHHYLLGRGCGSDCLIVKWLLGHEFEFNNQLNSRFIALPIAQHEHSSNALVESDVFWQSLNLLKS